MLEWKKRFRLTENDLRYGLIFLSSVVFSWIWICRGIRDTSAWQDGGRGGAIGVAIAFSTLFVRKDLGQKAYERIAVAIPKARRELAENIEAILQGSFPHEDEQALANRVLSDQFAGLLGEIRINSDGQTRQNWWIASASVFGTLVWGFGDWFCKFVLDHQAFCRAHHLMWMFFAK